MKRCPQCNAEYADETLNFCLEDGTSLIGALAVGADHPTAILSGGSTGERTQVFTSGSPQNSTGNSIAVLPFVNMSADADNEYFCDGLAEELLSALTKIDDLKVAARTAAFSFRGKNVPMAEIGQTLHVNTILEGSVRKAGNRVRITIQLINAADGYHLWSERYDRDMQDIFEIQDEITLAVVDALKVKLLAPEKRAMLKRHTNDPEAYQLYLRGRFFFYKRTPEGFIKAIEYFENAIKRDENYALAISGLADSYVFQGFYEMIPPAEAAEKVAPLVKRAVELDETSSETNTSRALEQTLYRWEHRESLKYFQAAIAADPKYALAYHLESAVSIALGESDASISAEKKAIEIDPFTPVFNASLGWWLYIARRNEESIQHCKRTIEIAPNHFFAYWILGLAYAIDGAYSDSVIAFQRAVALNQFEAHVRADLARVFAVMGEKEEALAILREFEELAATRYVSPVNFAKVYLGLGDDEKAIELIEKACDEKAVRLTYLLIDPIVAHLGDDSRFKDVCRRVGITDFYK